MMSFRFILQALIWGTHLIDTFSIFIKSYLLKREYVEIVNLGVKNILQALISVLFVWKSWNFPITCILFCWRTSAWQILYFFMFSFFVGKKLFFWQSPLTSIFLEKIKLHMFWSFSQETLSSYFYLVILKGILIRACRKKLPFCIYFKHLQDL